MTRYQVNSYDREGRFVQVLFEGEEEEAKTFMMEAMIIRPEQCGSNESIMRLVSNGMGSRNQSQENACPCRG